MGIWNIVCVCFFFFWQYAHGFRFCFRSLLLFLFLFFSFFFFFFFLLLFFLFLLFFFFLFFSPHPAGECKTIVEHPDQISAITWNYDGSLLATTCRDKVLRIIDPRTGAVVRQVEECHASTKPTRVCWLGRTGRILTTGFSKQGEREHAMWKADDLSLMHREVLELSPSQLQPFFDEDTGVLFLAGKGEARLRYLEVIDDPPYHFNLSEYSGTPCKGLALLPKSVVNTKDCEIDRFFMLTRDTVEPVHFTVPRKAATFQSDIFPETRDFSEAPLAAADFFGGQNADPKLVSMAPASGRHSSAVTSQSDRLAASSRLGRASAASSQEALPPAAAQQPAVTKAAPAVSGKGGEVVLGFFFFFFFF
jgi:hypothetical protein